MLVRIFGVPLEVDMEMREMAVVVMVAVMMMTVVVMVTEDPVAMPEPVSVTMSVTVTMRIWFRFGTAFHELNDIVD